VIRLVAGVVGAMMLASCGTPGESRRSSADWREAAPRHSVVVMWNEAMLAAIRNGGPMPTIVARKQFLVHMAMYDAWALHDGSATPVVLAPALRRPLYERTEANKEAAVSHAAYHALVRLFPDYETKSHAFRRLLQALGYPPATSGDSTTPAGIGELAARRVIESRTNDGSNAMYMFADMTSATYPQRYVPVNSADPRSPRFVQGDSFDLNRWQPLRVPTGAVRDSIGYPVLDTARSRTFRDQRYLTPHWGSVVPFALSAGNQFRPPPPPRAKSLEPYTDALGKSTTGDEAFRAQVKEILDLSAGLTDEHKVISEYWADGPRSETPPGHWNDIAQCVTHRDHHTLDDDVKLFFALNAALFDASIAAWEAKRAYDFVRPISAIQALYRGQTVVAWAGPNKGTQRIPALDWQPYQDPAFITPAFPEYVSGHSAFSAAAAAVLTAFTGSSRFYDGVTVCADEDFNRDGVPDMLGEYVGSIRFEAAPALPITLRWRTFQEAADQAGFSRRIGGIHFQDGDLRGRAMGKPIGEQAYLRAAAYWSGAQKPVTTSARP
jgi:hypothetical protein